ncbi:hypothetical protein EYR40_006769 [Pleurotus pulmonarius]|nr:hypothetical protein EYR36_011388 [Pleurotus pulmonarius]KAF4599670.1 hypothetical protein EYR40_006769 [Pleurotus pulmonarius]
MPMAPLLASPALELALFILRIVSPSLVFIATLSLVTTRPQPSEPSEPSPITPVVVAKRVPRRALILSFLSLSALSFLVDGLTFVVYAVFYKTWPSNTGIEFNAVIGLASFAGLAALGAWKDVSGVEVWSFKRVRTAIILSLGLDLATVVVFGLSLRSLQRHPPPHIPEKDFHLPLDALLHFAFPAFRVLLLVPLSFALFAPRVVYTYTHADEEVEDVPTASSFLLPPESGARPSNGLSYGSDLSGDASKYGTFRASRTTTTLHRSTPTTRATTPVPREAKPEAKSDIVLDPSWSEIWRRIRRLSPYLWPSKSRPLQGLAFICIIILLIGRVIAVLVPYTLGALVEAFEDPAKGHSPWPYLFAYVGLRFLQGSGGLSALRDAIWAPVMQYSDREMSQLSFDHLLNLSYSFHTRRKTGEILRILDRGAAINHTLELILFNIIPIFIDIFVAIIVFCLKFDWTLGLVIFIVIAAYITASIGLTSWRTKLRREMNERDVVTRGIHTDCLLNYETVKYFNGEEHEGARYRDALREYQGLELKVIIALNLLNLVQNFIITLGLLVGSLIVASRVTHGLARPSDFVMFITYLAQLYTPLNQLGYTYRSMNQSLVDTERLLKLLNEPTEVNDREHAPDLIVENGEIEFDNVNFSYDDHTTALRGVSFKVPKGSSVALVGESGAGKSTILRLLYRFYDLQEGQGRILIDGQDIRDVTQSSLRKAIGVVPQDPVLFNATIAYNIGYGKLGSTPEEIEAAAKSAQMHDRILSFHEGYDTKVGERGIRLSGGEKQRVAIARTLLKDPPILLLDEATSALDTSTEKDIQYALQNLVKGRSSLSIAHRLSTIASADLILVLKDGQVVEQGTHKELVAMDGIFASMWADQVSTTDEHHPYAESRSSKKNQSALSLHPEGSVIAHDAAPSEALSPFADAEPNVPSSSSHVEAPEVPPKEEAPSAAPIAFPSSDEPADAPISFPTTDTPDNVSLAAVPAPSEAVPIAFPSSDDTASQREIISPAQTPGVTFESSVNTPPRTGTPDVEGEPKRKLNAAQNFQRLARRISLTTRRQGSSSSISMIPGLRRGESTKEPTDASGRSSNDSPAESVASDDKTKKKKDKKEKRRKSVL